MDERLRARTEAIAARLLTVYYFAYFLIILPLLGLVEKTKPLPNSIAESVLGEGGAIGAMAASSLPSAGKA